MKSNIHIESIDDNPQKIKEYANSLEQIYKETKLINECDSKCKKLEEEIRLLEIEDKRWEKLSNEDAETINKLNKKIEKLERELFIERFNHFNDRYKEYGTGNIEEDCKEQLGVTYTEAQKIINQWGVEQRI